MSRATLSTRILRSRSSIPFSERHSSRVGSTDLRVMQATRPSRWTVGSRAVSTGREYEFVEALCASIEDYTAAAERQWPTAFVYAGANLRYAVERALYFRFVNSEHLYSYFTGLACGDSRL